MTNGMSSFIEGILLLGGTHWDDLSFREKLNVGFARAMRDSAPEIAELVSRVCESESEAEMEAGFDALKAMSAKLERETADYLAKKGISRRRGTLDVDAIEDDFMNYLESARARVGSVEPEARPESG